MSRDDPISRMIHVYQQPFFLGLTSNSTLAIQPPEIKLALKPHQLAMVHAMREREITCIEGFAMNGDINYSQYAILGDKVGSGKTLMMLGYLASLKSLPIDPVYSSINKQSKPGLWSRTYNTNDYSGNTLIIVPHTLYHQWKHAILKQTTLSVFEVKTNKLLESPEFFSLIKQRDITLMSNTIIKPFMSNIARSSVRWSRIIFDEVDNIHFTSTTEMPRANFYWLITATWANFIFQGLYMYMTEGYLSRVSQEGIHPDLISMIHQDQIVNGTNYYARYEIKSHAFFEPFISKHPNRGALILRNSNAFMEESWRTPPIQSQSILCESSIAHRIVASFVTPEIQELLHAGDITTALEKLGVTNTNQASLIHAVCESREKELDRLEKTLAFKETLDYSSPQAKEQSIQALKSKIQSLSNQIATLKERILHVKDEICAICYEEPTIPTFVMCCSRLFCGACILKCIQQKTTCPLCRASLDFKSLRHVESEANGDIANEIIRDSPKITVRKPKKKEALLKLITETVNGRFLVFNRYDNPFLEIEGELLTRGYRVANLRGNKDHISSMLKQFESGDIQILLMNSTQAGVGMDLKSATHIILMHSMRKEEETQIIGRAVRLGRTAPLNLIRLLHDEELSNATV